MRRLAHTLAYRGFITSNCHQFAHAVKRTDWKRRTRCWSGATIASNQVAWIVIVMDSSPYSILIRFIVILNLIRVPKSGQARA